MSCLIQALGPSEIIHPVLTVLNSNQTPTRCFMISFFIRKVHLSIKKIKWQSLWTARIGNLKNSQHKVYQSLISILKQFKILTIIIFRQVLAPLRPKEQDSNLSLAISCVKNRTKSDYKQLRTKISGTCPVWNCNCSRTVYHLTLTIRTKILKTNWNVTKRVDSRISILIWLLQARLQRRFCHHIMIKLLK